MAVLFIKVTNFNMPTAYLNSTFNCKNVLTDVILFDLNLILKHHKVSLKCTKNFY